MKHVIPAFHSVRVNAPPPPPRGPLLGRGAVVLLTGGLAVLAATAFAGRHFWADEGAQAFASNAEYPGLVPADVSPQVWIWSHDINAPVGFADPAQPEIPLVALRGHAPLPRIAEGYVASQQPPRASPAETGHSTEATAEATAEASTNTPAEPVPRIAAATTEAPATASPAQGPASMVPARPAVIASVPPVTPPRRPDRAHAQAPDPAAEQGNAPVIAAETPQRTPAAEPGLASSLLPRARPESVVRLASLAARPAAPSSASASTAATLAALDVPALAAGGRDSCPASLTRAIPRRPSGAAGGQGAIARLAATAGGNRDSAIAQAVIAGNLPDFLRQLVPVTVTGTGANGRPARITLCVMPDYLAMGSDADFVRVPLGLAAANRIAERFDMVLPTTRMVDAIHAQASVRLRPSPMTPGAQMASTDYFLRHNATLEGQRRSAGAPLGALVSGHKKDLVLSNRLERNPGRVAIYGWHQANGQPIQPLSTVHGAGYADYSHGIRLVSRTAFINGQAVDLRDLLGDGRYAGLISNEGPIAPRLIVASLR